MQDAINGKRGIIVVILFGSVCCVSIPLLLPLVASIGIGGLLAAAGVGLPLAVAVAVLGILGARWYRSRAHAIGPGLLRAIPLDEDVEDAVGADSTVVSSPAINDAVPPTTAASERSGVGPP